MRRGGNQFRATAVAATLLLHIGLAAWLLSLRISLPPPGVAIQPMVWLPKSRPLPPPPRVVLLAIPAQPIQPAPLLLPEPEMMPPESRTRDWYGDARAVAGALGGAPERHAFGAGPAESGQQPKQQAEPTVFEKPLPRVGTTVTTPEGETILWVSDYCYISLSSTSLTLQDFHQAWQGVRRCIIPIGERKPRDDLFEHLIREPERQQEPGCRKDGRAPSCTP